MSSNLICNVNTMWTRPAAYMYKKMGWRQRWWWWRI